MAVSKHARKPLSVGQRRQIVRQRRQAARQQQAQDPQPKRPVTPPGARRQDERLSSLRSQQSEGLRLSSSIHPMAPRSRRSVGRPTPLTFAPLSTTPLSPASKKAGRMRSRRSSHWLGNVLRLSFAGLGISAVIGTALAVLHPEPQASTLANSKLQTRASKGTEQAVAAGAMAETQGSEMYTALAGVTTIPILNPSQELTQAKQKIQAIAATQKGLTAGMFFYNPETGDYLNLGGEQLFSAASTIKLPILVAFFQAVDAGKVRLDESLVMRKDLVATESGVMQYQPVGTRYSALETADMMITISDNTATNMMIDRLGGIAALNQQFKSWGLTQVTLRNPLPDLQGTNTVTPKDLSELMLKLGQGELLTPRSRDLAMDILRRTETNTLLPPGLGKGSTIAHKTGDIGSVVGDAGLVIMPNGQRYVATVFVKRPHNDSRAQELIRQISKITYQALSTKQPSPPLTTATGNSITVSPAVP